MIFRKLGRFTSHSTVINVHNVDFRTTIIKGSLGGSTATEAKTKSREILWGPVNCSIMNNLAGTDIPYVAF